MHAYESESIEALARVLAEAALIELLNEMQKPNLKMAKAANPGKGAAFNSTHHRKPPHGDRTPQS